MPSLVRNKILDPLIAQLKQGTTPEKIAQSLAFGAVISCCPLLGATTALGVAAGVAFRLNHPALQAVNYLCIPAQLALMVPFFRAGERLFGLAPAPLRPDEIVSLFHADALAAARTYGGLALRGAAAWLLVAPVAVFVLSKALEPAVARLSRARSS